ncbi:DUF748 domain-containing protein [Caldimonas thermodepolymerans]|uniref:Uncharacterized protein DUF748 n=2 Tax=Caldimonas thermodepolymerans TaxID=215580 RepID=A0A2S5T8V2_9BURK|nr:DUF748 domain-containing protein [Caldimonas thermodepolymerans]PPE71389.1 hypothetical protein C1702_02935 [Caldimonas thermodepolymerans]QPC33334.1 DUF748 domain-containing protein [Caldimonas thermodepolymerans]RDH98962.1 uncharacterized protein DUF748 [Caldimonas thermodepolymerans]TCP06361.1 uncharacterized protein DUF748 [Caldimonas thermodepolymerans]
MDRIDPSPAPASRPRARRALVIALAVLLALATLGVVGFRVAVHQLQRQLEAALGPRSQVAQLRVGWNGVEALDVRVRGDRNRQWPAEDELRAQRVLVVPDLRSLLGGTLRIHRVRVEGGYVSMLRTRDGRLRVLPALTEERRADPGAADGSAPAVSIGRIELHDGTLEFFDASVRRPALKLRLERLQAGVGPLDLPALDSATQVELDGVLKGVQRDGRLHVAGRVTLATQDADIRARFAGVDLVALQPYLIKVSETGVRRGTLDLRLDAKVKDQRLRAPGHLTLSDLQLHSSGVLGTFAGVPRQAVIAAMSRNGRLELDFTLEGRLDDPKFSLNENLAVQVASGLARSLGVSVGGVVEGVGNMVKGLFGR